MIRIRNESDLKNWFKKNYQKLGFTKIIRKDIGIFPDFIMLEEGKKIKVELEIKSSNFILHKHSIKRVNKVICIKKDAELGVPIIELNNFKLIEFNKYSHYSIENQIYGLIKKEKIVTTNEAAKKLNLSYGAAEKGLMELLLKNVLERKKKDGVTLWLRK